MPHPQQARKKHIFKFVVDLGDKLDQREPTEIKMIAWFSGTPLEQVQMEILKAAGINDF